MISKPTQTYNKFIMGFSVACLFLSLAFLFGGIKITTTRPPVAIPSFIKPVGDCNQQGMLKLAWSISHDPQSWHPDNGGFRLSNGDMSLWIANEDYGLKLAPESSGSSDGVAIPENCKLVVYHAVQNWSSAYANDNL